MSDGQHSLSPVQSNILYNFIQKTKLVVSYRVPYIPEGMMHGFTNIADVFFLHSSIFLETSKLELTPLYKSEMAASGQ